MRLRLDQMKTGGLLLFIIFAMGCHSVNQKNKQADKKDTGHQSDVKHTKKPVDINRPVAVFSANKEDKVTDNDFTVQVFPTEDPEEFRVSIEYGGNKAQDKIDFPPPEYYKKVALRSGKSTNACLLGFIGADGKFNEMKEISGTGTQIKIKSLKAYYFTTKTKE